MERVIRRSAQLRQVDKLVRDMLAAELREHCRVANIRGDTIVLFVSSTVWATRIRYLIPKLLGELQQLEALKQITEIQFKVQPLTTAEPRKKSVRRVSMSRDAALCVEQCAASIDDVPLRSALQQLAKRRTDKR
ncbi:MAG: DUF721 domain-containing protein [Gammaproteobacteria bacterium]|nr:DUF721 domain-containing protein [Gammaproteobacteria bacterium]MCW8840089.1 DUF721 domain-containing protein [Gammaproteobacteria bacterium]MCW8928070.1 DUF721 domain-containing protein [Gammaproteobacteria bacterium]MCW8959741.1 DUF721 domain-containing protein [Gammaproteobacteria bacterium]MCW8973890.1 DUF721 domain-containing protein [Gammaproteobacteria bacterium]